MTQRFTRISESPLLTYLACRFLNRPDANRDQLPWQSIQDWLNTLVRPAYGRFAAFLDGEPCDLVAELIALIWTGRLGRRYDPSVADADTYLRKVILRMMVRDSRCRALRMNREQSSGSSRSAAVASIEPSSCEEEIERVRVAWHRLTATRRSAILAEVGVVEALAAGLVIKKNYCAKARGIAQLRVLLAVQPGSDC